MTEHSTRATRRLPSTHWSDIFAASRGDDPGSFEALDRVLRAYLPALSAHLMGKFRFAEDEAREWLHIFVERKVLAKEFLSHANPERGRFRTFLLNSLDRFVVAEQRRARALKRGAGIELVSLDELGENEQGIAAAPRSREFEMAWARAVLTRALQQMRAECEEQTRHDVWGVFEGRLLRSILEGAEPVPYGELVERFHLESPAQASNVLITSKRMFVRHLRAVIAEYATDECQVEREVWELRAVLSGG